MSPTQGRADPRGRARHNAEPADGRWHRVAGAGLVPGKHIGDILAKLELPPSGDTNRRVLAVLTYPRTGPPHQRA